MNDQCSEYVSIEGLTIDRTILKVETDFNSGGQYCVECLPNSFYNTEGAYNKLYIGVDNEEWIETDTWVQVAIWTSVSIAILVGIIIAVIIFFPGAGLGGASVLGTGMMGLSTVIMVPGTQILTFLGIILLIVGSVIFGIFTMLSIVVVVVLTLLSPVIGLFGTMFVTLLATVGILISAAFVMTMAFLFILSPFILTGILVAVLIPTADSPTVSSANNDLFDIDLALAHFSQLTASYFPDLDLLALN